MSESTDVVVLGIGVGGETVAEALADRGADVVAVEPELVGGECPYWACIPTKMMVRAGDLLAQTHRVDGIAGHAEARADWGPVASRIRQEATTDWDDTAAVERFTGKGGRFVRGRGRLIGPGQVDAEGKTYEARLGVVVATGSAPAAPPIDGLAETPYWTNREAVKAETPPASLLVLGGGAVGLELAQVYARFGSAVTVVEAQDRLLPAEEPESSDVVRTALEADGVVVRAGRTAAKVSHDGTQFSVGLDDGSDLHAERLLLAVGRRARMRGVGLESVGIDASAPALAVDEHMRAGKRLWAVGDVTGHGLFTHVATYQAGFAVRDILDDAGPGADYRAVPRVTFTDPEIGAVGMTEAQARESGHTVRTGIAQVPSTARGWIHKAGNEGVIKLVADIDGGVLVGATSAGPVGGEVLGALAVAVHGAVPVERLQHMMYAYPTFHRGIEDALRQLG